MNGPECICSEESGQCGFHYLEGLQKTQELNRPTNPKENFLVEEYSVPMMVDKKDYDRLIDASRFSTDEYDIPLFTIMDSGKRQHFASGMQRDVTTDKIDYSLCFDGPMFERLAVHLTKGAKKYDARNWMKAESGEERDRFKSSAIRHFMQWMRGDRDEDHAAAVMFNINGYEYVNDGLKESK